MKKVLRFLLKIAAWFLLFSVLIVLLYKWVPVPYTPLMAIRHYQNPEESIRHDWIPIEKISPNLQLAVVASEDQNFLDHNGLDFEAIQKAIEEGKQRKRIRGASTISQQTAKNVFLWPGRNWIRKTLEVYFTVLIEIIWGKERILEVYLNSIEMGRGVYGAEAASIYWYGKPASALGVAEAAGIAAILPNPHKYKANPAGNYVQQRKNWISRQMQNIGSLKFKD